jgi:hypothetical protein
MLRVDSCEQGEQSGRCSGDQHASDQDMASCRQAAWLLYHVGVDTSALLFFRRGTTPFDLLFKHTMLWCFETY